MAITGLKTWVSSDVLNTTNLNNDKSVIEAKFNGAITTADLSAAAGITNGQLANSKYEIVLTLMIPYIAASNGLLAAVTSNFLIGSIPYDATDGEVAYTIVGIEHMTTIDATGGALIAPVYNLEYGNATDGWTTIKNGITVGITNFVTTREAGFATTVSTDSTRPWFFKLDVVTQGVNYGNGCTWTIAIKLKKGLRA
jgi:hypothetical protein